MSLTPQQVHVSENYARKLTENIRRTAVNAKESIDKLNDLIQQAKNGNAHLALGYKSWTAYLSDTFAETPMLLERDARQAFVAQLSSEGMSVRAIAPIVGASVGTVHADQQVFRNEQVDEPKFDPTPEPESSVVELCPEVAPSAPAEEVTAPVEPQVPGAVTINPATGEVLDTPIVTEHTVTEKTKTVVGLDGKSYTSKATTPRRSSIIDTARNAGWQLRKAAERLERIQQDDRFTKNKAEIMAALQPHLDFADEVISGL